MAGVGEVCGLAGAVAAAYDPVGEAAEAYPDRSPLVLLREIVDGLIRRPRLEVSRVRTISSPGPLAGEANRRTRAPSRRCERGWCGSARLVLEAHKSRSVKRALVL